MIVVESPLTAKWKLEPLFIEVGTFRIDIVPFVIAFVTKVGNGQIRYEVQLDSYLDGMVDTLNELLEDGVRRRPMSREEEAQLRLCVTLRIYQVFCGVGEPAES